MGLTHNKKFQNNLFLSATLESACWSVPAETSHKLLFYFFCRVIALSFGKLLVMKKSMWVRVALFCLFFLYLHSARAQSDNLTIKYLRMDGVTGPGKPTGEEVSQETGKDGGTIVSDDGRIELIFPADALNKKKK
jgi:hypothetical protein